MDCWGAFGPPFAVWGGGLAVWLEAVGGEGLADESAHALASIGCHLAQLLPFGS